MALTMSHFSASQLSLQTTVNTPKSISSSISSAPDFSFHEPSNTPVNDTAETANTLNMITKSPDVSISPLPASPPSTAHSDAQKGGMRH